MPKFNVTFGVQYSREPHPTLGIIHPNGYVSIIAEDEESARSEIFRLIGPSWAFIYPEGEITPALYPLGELFSIEVGADPVDVKFVLLAVYQAIERASTKQENDPPVWSSVADDNNTFIFEHFNY